LQGEGLGEDPEKSFYSFAEKVVSGYIKRDLNHLKPVTDECKTAIGVFTKTQKKETNTKVRETEVLNLFCFVDLDLADL
jgi:hypothetical protein